MKNNKIRIFIKFHRSNRKINAFSCFILGANGETSTMLSAGTAAGDESQHRIALKAICAYLETIRDGAGEDRIIVVFYADNDEIAYEWNREYLEEGKFADSTEDVDLYRRIIRLQNRKKIRIEIRGKDNMLSGIGRLI
ncbi:MAG: hypothetical protein IJI83_03090 [Oscillospiraceae bacterium]|nr:hypothetical protein [Oscillospiraceae bacterium]